MTRATTHTTRFDTVSDPSTMGLRDLAASFKLLADETRLRVLSLLIQSGELNVRTLCSYLDQSQPAVSHHLALLRDAGVIEARRDGKHNYYRCISGRLENLIDGNWRGVMEQADCDPRSKVSGETSPTLSSQNGNGRESSPTNGTRIGFRNSESTDAVARDTIGRPRLDNRLTDSHEFLRASTPQSTDDLSAAARADCGAAPVAEPG